MGVSKSRALTGPTEGHLANDLHDHLGDCADAEPQERHCQRTRVDEPADPGARNRRQSADEPELDQRPHARAVPSPSAR